VTEATAAMSAREWTPGKRSMEGREGPVRRATLRQQCRRRSAGPGRIPGEQVGNPRPGHWNQNSGEERSPGGPALGGRSNALGETAMRADTRDVSDDVSKTVGSETNRLKPRRSSRVTDKDERGAGRPTSPLEQQRRRTKGTGVSRFRSSRP